MSEEKNMIELEEEWIVIRLPKNTITADVTAKVWDGEKVVNVIKKLEMEDVKDAFRKAADGYIDEDDEFVITDEFKKAVDEAVEFIMAGGK